MLEGAVFWRAGPVALNRTPMAMRHTWKVRPRTSAWYSLHVEKYETKHDFLGPPREVWFTGGVKDQNNNTLMVLCTLQVQQFFVHQFHKRSRHH
jgi:hypothetical protein